MKKFVFVLAALFSSFANATTVASVSANGTFFKDEIYIESFQDPEVPSVVCYVTYYDRAGLGPDSSVSSLSCIQIGNVSSVPNDNQNIFKMNKALLKQTKVARFYDRSNNTLIYLVYPASLNSGNAAHEISAVKLH